ncbi:S26 family signal peptidase [Bradyrhizobium sp. CNPSo 4026]|nr:S26 family signal peptidase [Bradyrhizobium cenepequi]
MPIDRARLWRQATILSAMCAGIVTLLIWSVPAVPLLIYNASGSAPLGFYYMEQRLPMRGELAVFKPPPAVELLIITHQILPVPVPLLKQVTAIGGDEYAAPRSRSAPYPSMDRSPPKCWRRTGRGARCQPGKAA